MTGQCRKNKKGTLLPPFSEKSGFFRNPDYNLIEKGTIFVCFFFQIPIRANSINIIWQKKKIILKTSWTFLRQSRVLFYFYFFTAKNISVLLILFRIWILQLCSIFASGCNGDIALDYSPRNKKQRFGLLTIIIDCWDRKVGTIYGNNKESSSLKQ